MDHVFDAGAALTIRQAERSGEEEIRRCRAAASQRNASQLVPLVRGAVWRRVVRATAALLPPVTARLARARRRAAFLRGASREARPEGGLGRYLGATLPVLVYHHVGPPHRGCWPLLTVSPARFAAHVKWLARARYVGITPCQWLEWRLRGVALPARPVLITFDDAYADIARHALPVLVDHGFAAGVFLVSQRIGSTSTWDRAAGYEALSLMSEAQIHEWHGRGIEFGAHGRTHADLRRLSTDAIDDEVEGSADDLARLLGVRPISFAYPYGAVDPRVRSRVARSFEAAFVVQAGRGMNDISTDPLVQLRSLVEPRDNALDVMCRTCSGVRCREWLISGARQHAPEP